MKFNQKGFSPLIVLVTIVALAVIGGAVYYVYQKNNNKDSEANLQSESRDNVSEIDSETKNWQVLENEEAAFTFKYPDSWKSKDVNVSDEDNKVYIGVAENEPKGVQEIEPEYRGVQVSVDLEGATLIMGSTDDGQVISQTISEDISLLDYVDVHHSISDGSDFTKKQTRTIGGEEAIRYTVEDFSEDNVALAHPGAGVTPWYVKKGSNFYAFEFQYISAKNDKDDYKKSLDLFNKILDTVQFN